MAILGTTGKVMTGIYTGFTRAEMLTEFARYKAAVITSGSRLGGATVNGQNFQFGPRSDMTLHAWNKSVLSALAQVDPDYLAPQSAIAVRFGTL